MTTCDLLQLATEYHKALPGRIRRYLNERGITDLLIDFHLLGWNGHRITIPIFNREGELAFFKLAKDPEDQTPGPKMLATPGAYAELYGWDQVLRKPAQTIICEGEFDRLVLEAQGFIAVTSTGGAGVFRAEWRKEFEAIPEVYVCYDNDAAGREGAARVAQMIPHAKVVELSDEVGPSGDVTDFLVRLGHSRADLEKLMAEALPLPPAPPAEHAPMARAQPPDPALRERIDRIKREVPIVDAIGRYVKLQGSGDRLAGLCPFHSDRNPSFVVFPATGTFHCFGCAKHGDVITFMREMENLSFREALERLGSIRAGYSSASP